MKMHVKNKNWVTGLVKRKNPTQTKNVTNAMEASQNKAKLIKVGGEKEEK